MSRNIVHIGGLASGRVLCLVAPAVLFGLDCVGAEDFAGGVFCDGRVVFVDEDEDVFAGVVASDAKVVKAAGSAQGEFAELIDRVDSDSVVVAEWRPGWGGFDGCVVGLAGYLVRRCTVGTLLVVDDPEPIELLLQGGDGVSWGLFGMPFLEGVVETFDLALSLRMVGVAILLLNAESGAEVFEGVTRATQSCGVNESVVGQGGCWRSEVVESVNDEAASDAVVGGAAQ